MVSWAVCAMIKTWDGRPERMGTHKAIILGITYIYDDIWAIWVFNMVIHLI